MNYLASTIMASLALSWQLVSLAQAPDTMQRQIPDRPPTESFPELAEVEALARAGKVQEEEQKVRQIREANPSRKEPLIYIGQRRTSSAPAKARPFFEQAAIIDPDDPFAQPKFCTDRCNCGSAWSGARTIKCCGQKETRQLSTGARKS